MSQQIPDRLSGGAVDLSHLAARPQSAAGAPTSHPAASAEGAAGGQVVDVPSLVLDVTDQLFEQVAQLSNVVPVVVHLLSNRSEQGASFADTLARVTKQLAGKVLLANVDVDANPGLAQAFQAQAVPTVVALVAGRPVPLFQGALDEDQVREFFSRLLELAAQHGVTGMLNAPDSGEAADDEPALPQVNPAHQPALDALESGDYAGAVQAYEQVLLKAPADAEARAALVQVRLLHRLDGVAAEEVRSAAATHPNDIDAQMLVADLDVSGGHIEDAFLRLLDLFSTRDDDTERTRLRERLLELFEVVGLSDARVAAARTRLANLLY